MQLWEAAGISGLASWAMVARVSDHQTSKISVGRRPSKRPTHPTEAFDQWLRILLPGSGSEGTGSPSRTFTLLLSFFSLDAAPGGRPALIEEIRQLAAQERLERGGPAGQPSVAGVLGSGGIPVASGVGGVGLGPAEAAAAWQPPAKPKPTIPPSGTQASPTQPPTTALQTSGGNDGGRDSEDAAASIARPVLVPETMSIEEIQSSGAESGGGGAGVALGPFSE